MSANSRTSSNEQSFYRREGTFGRRYPRYALKARDRVGSSTLEQVEREHVVRVLRETGGVVTKAAERLGMPRTTLNALMRKLGITRREI